MKKFIQLLIPGLLFLFSSAASANQGYIELSPAQPTQTGDKIEVLEIFWYACPHCYDFEPYIHDWLDNKPDDVEFRRMPGIFRKTWIPHAKAFFTAEKMGILDQIHTPLFDAIHKERKKIHDDAAFKKFFAKQGVDKGEFKKVYNSDEVDTKVKQAFVMVQHYKTRNANGKSVPAVTGVPAVIVNGKYLVSGSTAGSFSNVLKIIDQLVDKERASTVKE